MTYARIRTRLRRAGHRANRKRTIFFVNMALIFMADGLENFVELPTTTRLLRLNFVGPKIEPGGHCVDGHRHGEECAFGDRKFWWPVACEQKEHPWQQNHGIAI